MDIIVAISNVFRRELSSFILSEAGYTVYEASDSTMLLDYLHCTHPQLVLLDAQFVGADSAELTRQIRQDQAVPIMVLTKRSSLSECSRPMFESDDYLDWPYQAEELLSQVDALLHRNSNSPVAATVPAIT
jgi:two-component system OmpR family response regulator